MKKIKFKINRKKIGEQKQKKEQNKMEKDIKIIGLKIDRIVLGDKMTFHAAKKLYENITNDDNYSDETEGYILKDNADDDDQVDFLDVEEFNKLYIFVNPSTKEIEKVEEEKENEEFEKVVKVEEKEICLYDKIQYEINRNFDEGIDVKDINVIYAIQMSIHSLEKEILILRRVIEKQEERIKKLEDEKNEM